MLSIRGKNKKSPNKVLGQQLKTGIGLKEIGIKNQYGLEPITRPNSKDSCNNENSKIMNSKSNLNTKSNKQMDSNASPLNSVNSENKNVSTRLQGSLFRKINEFLYINNSEEAFSEYNKDSNMFENYHKGYEIQKKSWPIDPLDHIISYISKNKHLKIIGDFGCGTAKIGQIYGQTKGYKVYSFDLNCSKEISKKYNITICNMKNVPLNSKVLDLAVFCLSLMGTDWPLFIKEACRTLKDNGILIIAEVSSRIEDSKSFVFNFKKHLNLELVQVPTNLTDYFTLFIFKKKPSAANHSTKLFTHNSKESNFNYFTRKNKHHFSNLKYKYGLKLYWIRKISTNFKSIKLNNSLLPENYYVNEPHINHNLLKPCLYKKR